MSPKKLPIDISPIANQGEIKPSADKLPTKSAIVPPGRSVPITGNPSPYANKKTAIARAIGEKVKKVSEIKSEICSTAQIITEIAVRTRMKKV